MALWLSASAAGAVEPSAGDRELRLSPQDRILVLAPHPDDEVLGCGGVIQQAVAMNLPLRIVFLTHGDNYEWSFLVYRKRPVLWPGAVRKMGMVRYDEAIAAAGVLGVPATNLTFLGYPDHGTLRIWEGFWRDRPPYRAMLTGARAVPYADALRPGALYKGEEILGDLRRVVRRFRPTKIFVSHPADHNPDHQALYLFTRVALWELEGAIKPQLYPYLIHFRRWPWPRGYQPDEPLDPPPVMGEPIAWRENRLTPVQIERKRAALLAHRSQYRSSAKYLLSFVRRNELFGDFPAVRLSAAARRAGVGDAAVDVAARADMPEELTDFEQAAFVGVEWRFARLKGNQLELSIQFSKPLARGVEASIYVFGYRTDRPFDQMPKIHLKLGEFSHAAYDQNRKLARETFAIERETDGITVRIPLQALGSPTRVLTSAQTYLADVPLDWVSWQVLELPVADAH